MNYRVKIRSGFKGYGRFMESLENLDEPCKESMISRHKTLLREAKAGRALKTAKIEHGSVPLVFAYSDGEAGEFMALERYTNEKGEPLSKLEIGSPKGFRSVMKKGKYYVFGKDNEGCLYYLSVFPHRSLGIHDCKATKLPDDLPDIFLYLTSPAPGRLEVVRVGHRKLHIRPDKAAEERPEELIIEI